MLRPSWRKACRNWTSPGLLGRVGWQKINDGKREGAEWFARKLRTVIHGERELEPANFLLQVISAHAEKAGSGKLNVDGLNLKIFGDLVEYLPIMRAFARTNHYSLAAWRNTVHARPMGWRMASASALQCKREICRFRFEEIPNLPSFSGITGNINITEKGGTLNLKSERIKLEFPSAFHEPLILDILTGQASWRVSENNSVAFKFSNIAFSNSDVSGLAYGTYRARSEWTGRDRSDRSSAPCGCPLSGASHSGRNSGFY